METRDREALDKYFKEAEYFWKLNELYHDLGVTKKKPLSVTEKVHLRGLLCGYSPTNIAKTLNKSVRGVESELCNTIYQYVKALLNNSKIENWRNVSEWLEKAQYKILSNPENNPDNNPEQQTIKLPIDGLEGVIKIDKMIDNHGIIFEINLRVVTTLPNDKFERN